MPANPVFTDGDYSSASAVSAFITAPAFDGDATHYLGQQNYCQAKSSYTPLALGTAHPDDSDFKLVREDSFTDLGEGIISWTRHYAKLPAQRIEQRSLAWERPGLGMGGLNPITTVLSVTGITTATGFYNEVTINTNGAPGVAAGDYIIIYLGEPSDKYHSQSYTTAQVVSAGPASVVVPQGVLGQFAASAIQKYNPGGTDGRKPETKTVPAKVVFDYYETADSTTIPILEPAVVRDSFGLITDTYQPTTSPSLATYLGQIAAGDWIVAQYSVSRRWQGNFWERETIYVKAQ